MFQDSKNELKNYEKLEKSCQETQIIKWKNSDELNLIRYYQV